VANDPVPGLYEQLVTEGLTRLLAVAEHLQRIIERALRTIPEEERLTRQAELL
jgi:hypothetical protein